MLRDMRLSMRVALMRYAACAPLFESVAAVPMPIALIALQFRRRLMMRGAFHGA